MSVDRQDPRGSLSGFPNASRFSSDRGIRFRDAAHDLSLRAYTKSESCSGSIGDPQHDSLLVYARSERSWAASRNLMPRSEENLEAFGNPDNDPRGSWRSTDMSAQGGHATAAQFYDLELPGGRVLRPPPVSYTHLTLPT